MSIPHNPFSDLPKAQPGHGTIHIANLAQPKQPPTAVLQTLEYQYPLKLVAPGPLPINTPAESKHDADVGGRQSHDLNVYTIFILGYGGGLVAGDAINLSITLDPATRLNLLTQGSTKIFKTRPGTFVPSASVPSSSDESLTTQTLTVHVGSHAALVYLPDPVQPFADSRFAQAQHYILSDRTSSLCVLDWVTSGRSARGENWDCDAYSSRNEVFAAAPDVKGRGRLLVRDNIFLHSQGVEGLEGVSIRERVNKWAIVGTLIVTGPLFEGLSKFFMNEFELLPRIGAPKFAVMEGRGDSDGEGDERRRKWRERRWEREKRDGVLWTASRVRDVFVVVKFVAPSVEGARAWLRAMLEEEGGVERAVGERGLMCLR